MRTHLLFAIALAAFALPTQSAGLLAQDPPDPADRAEGDSVITVTGALPEGERLARGVDAITPAPQAGEALPRFLDPLCLTVGGANSGQSGTMKRMIEEHARALDIEVAPFGCTLNAVVVAVDDPQGFVDGMLEDQPHLAKADHRTMIERAFSQGDPAFAWGNHEVRTAQGTTIMPSGELGGPTQALGYAIPVTRGGRPRRLGLNRSVALANAIVVIDARQLEGASLRQIADYAAMRLFAPTSQTGWAEELPPSILSLFADGPEQAPIGLTDFDIAYLRGLYALEPNAQATQLRGRVLREYRSELAGD